MSNQDQGIKVEEKQVAGEANKTYIGKEAIKIAETNKEANLVNVILENGQKLEFSLRQYESVCSNEPYDDGLINRKKWNPVVTILLTEMLNDGAVIADKDVILSMLDNSVVTNYNNALSQLFGCNHPSNANLKVIDAVLKHKGSINFEEPKVEKDNSKE